MSVEAAAEKLLLDTVNETVSVVAQVLHVRALKVDAAPSGLDAVALVATLRAFARLTSMPFSADAVVAAQQLEETVFQQLMAQAMAAGVPR